MGEIIEESINVDEPELAEKITDTLIQNIAETQAKEMLGKIIEKTVSHYSTRIKKEIVDQVADSIREEAIELVKTGEVLPAIEKRVGKIVQEKFDGYPLKDQLKGYDACFFCMGK